jgi:hypothetical protein
MSKPIQPARLGDVTLGYYAAQLWAQKFYYSKKRLDIKEDEADDEDDGKAAA